ncbi:MAG TPA: hypothetical protein VES39_02450, partial [Rhodospirillales bacterium]|nr:hypothetical protein [Rhodospirillales bacterium]
MPEYLAPGVFVEEVSFRPQSIEGVSTSTTGFVGPTRFGPIYGEPPLLTNFRDFEAIYGGLDRLEFAGAEPSHNDLAHAVRAYFEEGGVRLYVARTYDLIAGFREPAFSGNGWSAAADGIARWPESGGSPSPAFGFRARYPGAAANVAVSLVFRLGENILDTFDGAPRLRGAAAFDTVLAAAPGATLQAYWLQRFFDETQQRDTFRLCRGTATPVSLRGVDDVRILTVSVLVAAMGRFGSETGWENLTFDPRHGRSLSAVFAPPPTRRSTELNVPLVFGAVGTDGAAIADALLQELSQSGGRIGDGLLPPGSPPVTPTAEDRTFRFQLAHGDDGTRPDADDYEGDERNDGQKSGLLAFEDLEDISIVAAPG